MLALVGLSDRIDGYPDDLSGGQQQRVAIARPLAVRPRVRPFDEVTSALGPEPTGEVLAVMERLAKGGMTILMVTFAMGFARRVASTTVLMHKGRIHESGPSRQMVEAPRIPEMAQFIRSDVKEVRSGRVVGRCCSGLKAKQAKGRGLLFAPTRRR